MFGFDVIAEQRIRDAMDAGEFDDLPGAGRRLVLDDDALIPVGLRAAYRILANAGVAPEEVRLRRLVAELESQLETDSQAMRADEEASADACSRRRRSDVRRRLALLRLRLEASVRGRRCG